MSPGRPNIKLEINFRNPLESLDKISNMCSNSFIRANVISFARALLTIAGGSESESKSCQTDIDANNLIGCAYEKDSAENFIEAVCDVTKDQVKMWYICIACKCIERRSVHSIQTKG